LALCMNVTTFDERANSAVLPPQYLDYIIS
jgi:hypothetical protein